MLFRRRLWDLFWPSLNKGHLLISRAVLPLALLEVGISFSDLVNSSAAPGFHNSVSCLAGEKQTSLPSCDFSMLSSYSALQCIGSHGNANVLAVDRT